jgi:hypothetical protein
MARCTAQTVSSDRPRPKKDAACAERRIGRSLDRAATTLNTTSTPGIVRGAKTIRGEEAMNEVRREPPINEILRDPLTRLLMERDGVDEATLWRLLEQVRQRIARKPQRIVA